MTISCYCECPVNKTVDNLNNKMIEQFPGQEHVYRSFDSLQESDHILPEEFLNTLTPSGLPPHS